MLHPFRKYWHADQDELQLLLDWNDPASDPDQPWRLRTALGGAILYHIALILMGLYGPSGVPRGRELPIQIVDLRRATPLIAPIIPNPLTQKAPNKSKPVTEVDLAGLMPRPPVDTPAAQKPGRPVPPSPKFQAPAPSTEPSRTVEAPKLDVSAQVPLTQGPPALGVQIQPQEKPKLALERVGESQGVASGNSVLKPKVDMPKPGVDEAARAAMRQTGRGLIVGDTDALSGGISEMMRQNPSPGKTGSALELISDPMGIDFRPYLVQVLSAVRRNWLSILPESARLGRSGRVLVQFSIAKDGRVPKLVIAMPSGADALDRAAVAGISMSNPFPPLPMEFKGEQIRLQFNFSYNMPAR